MTVWRRLHRSDYQGVSVGTLVVPKKKQELEILILDAKHFSIHKKPFTFYVGWNYTELKPLCWILLPRTELKDGYDRILAYCRSLKLNIKAVVSDWHKGIIASVKEFYPKAVHQRCAAHVLQHAFRKIQERKLLQSEYGRKIWSIIRKIALELDFEKDARKYFYRVKKKYPEHLKAWRVLEKSLPDIYQFSLVDFKVPRTSNRIENFMGVLEQRLKLFRSAKSAESLIQMITHLIIYKQKRPTKK